ncbi:MAG: hypothetical protein IJI07_08955, partial [Flexilinea sp.]|nr:hypothetical protein [Flexilinea sp.]
EPGSNSPLNFLQLFQLLFSFFTDHFAGIVWFVLFLLLLNCQGSYCPFLRATVHYYIRLTTSVKGFHPKS